MGKEAVNAELSAFIIPRPQEGLPGEEALKLLRDVELQLLHSEENQNVRGISTLPKVISFR
jgi:hypothetical protein